MSWFHVSNSDSLPSPSLLIYRDRVEANLQQMLTEVGGQTERLRPHLKTHKLPQILWRQLDLGIRKVKCATIAEAEMAALAGVEDILLAGQPVGANALRFLQLVSRFPRTEFSCLADDVSAVRALADLAGGAGVGFDVLVDVNVGQNRSGVPPDERALQVFEAINESPTLIPGGLHGYDGHLSMTDVAERERACEAAFADFWRLRDALLAKGLEVTRIVVGGSPTFPIHARNAMVECSPGTCLLWDAGYARKLPDLKFEPAAALFCRVISKPGTDLLSLDLGHKAVGSEMPHPRAIFPDLPDAEALMHNEEHLVIRSSKANEFSVGQGLFAIPWHICPTVALHSEVWAVADGEATECWPVVGRARRLSI